MPLSQSYFALLILLVASNITCRAERSRERNRSYIAEESSKQRTRGEEVRSTGGAEEVR